MARIRVAWLVILFVGGAAAAEAQSAFFNGLLTGHLGIIHNGDVRDPGITPGVSLAVIDDGGLGAEIDLAYANTFDDARFADSSVSSVMLNFMAVYMHPQIRPFLVVGGGVVGVRAAIFEDQPTVSRTDLGLSAGGGVLYVLSDAMLLRGDLRYFRHFDTHQDLQLIDNSFFDYWRTSIGVTYSWPIR